MESSSTITLTRQEPRAASLLLGTMLLGWAFLAWAVLDMTHPLAKLMMPMSPAWSMGNMMAIFIMWAVMMMAMMLPSATPMVLTFVRLCRHKHQILHGWIFVAAYLVIWSGFSAAATALHWWLQTTGLLSPMMTSSSMWFTAILLLVAGVVQFTPLKDACLRHCRTPMGYLLTEWKDGAVGAWRMGVKHGLICLGCCWALMGLLYVAGVMNLVWVAALTTVVIIEKLHPAGVKIGKFLGGALIALGIIQIVSLSIG
ncbi:MAG: putative metal-binding membrane protein [Gammaproteobacteria bacterium]|jgi:predicted metal-binding membrane protein